MAMDFFTADLHLFHKSVIGFCQRPFKDIDHMHHELIARWNCKVAPNDTVYVLGDASFGNRKQTMEIIPQLHGHKVLGLGNHDWGRSVTWWKAVGFQEVKSGLFMVQGFRCLHFPEMSSMVEHDKRNYLLPYAAPSDGTPLLHGHVHTAWKKLGNQLNVGVDVWDYAPASLPEIESAMASIA